MNILQAGVLMLLCMMSTMLCAKEKKAAKVNTNSEMSSIQLVDDDWKTEVSNIDKEIDKLSNQRNLYLAKATRLQNQGDRLQFENDNNLIDARRAWQQAQIHREIATRIQEEIDGLERRKHGILAAHGALPVQK